MGLAEGRSWHWEIVLAAALKFITNFYLLEDKLGLLCATLDENLTAILLLIDLTIFINL